MASLYELLFGKEHIQDGTVIDFAEHGRVGGLSTNQGFKYQAIIDPVSGNSPTVTGGKLDVNATVTLGNITVNGADGRILDASNASLTANIISLTNFKALATAIVDGSGNQITNFGAQATVTAIQGDPGSKAWLVTSATLPITNAFLDVPLSTRLASGSTLPVTGTLTVIQPTPGNLKATVDFSGSGLGSVQFWDGAQNVNNQIKAGGGSLSSYQGGVWSISSLPTLTVIQGNAGSQAWLVTQATLSVVASGAVTANAGTNLNTSSLAVESGGNLASILAKLDVSLGSRQASGGTLPMTNAFLDTALSTRLASGSTLPVTNAFLDVALSTRLASGSTLPVTGTLGALNAGGSLTAYQGGTWTVQPGNTPNTVAWLATLATLPVFASQAGTWTVQPGNTPNTVAWLATLATLPVFASQAGTWAIASLPTLTIQAEIPGVGATNLGKAEDAAHTTGDTGVFILGVRNDSLASLTNTDLDYTSPAVDGIGRVYVSLKSLNAMTTAVSGATTSVTLLAANMNRMSASFFNNSTATLYLKFGANASIPMSFKAMLAPNAYYEIPPSSGYTGLISGVWSGVKNGVVNVSEEY